MLAFKRGQSHYVKRGQSHYVKREASVVKRRDPNFILSKVSINDVKEYVPRTGDNRDHGSKVNANKDADFIPRV